MRTPLRLAVCAGFAAAAEVPVDYTSDGGLQVNKACANGVCCREIGSMCSVAGNVYTDVSWSASGTCPKQDGIDGGFQ